MSNNTLKYALGGAAAAGATYYIYQQRLEQAQQPVSSFQLPSFGKSNTPEDGIGERTGRKLDQSAIEAKDKLKDLQYDAGKKIDSSFAHAEHQKSKLTSWASEKLDSAADSLSSESERAKAKADALYKEAHKDDPTGLRKFGNEVKEGVIDARDSTERHLSDAKDSVVGSASSLKNSIIGSKNKAEHEVNRAIEDGKAKAEDAKDQTKSWFNSLGSTKDQEVALNARKSLEGWGETAKQNADDYYDSLTSKAGEAKSSFFSWGSRKRAKADAALQNAYDDAQRAVNDAQKKFDDTKSSWFSWKQDENKKKLHAEAERQLNNAKSQLDQASSKLEEWKERAKRVANENKPQQSPGFYNWLRGDNISPNDEVRLARTARNSLRGWGESAEEFARDELEESNRNLQYAQSKADQLREEAQANLNSWSKWANKKYASNVDGAQEYYKDAQEALKDAQREVQKSTSSWFSWGSNKSKEVELEAKKNLEDAQKRVQSAADGLAKWGVDVANDLGNSILSGADRAISETKKGLDSLHSKTQDGLNDAQQNIREHK